MWSARDRWAPNDIDDLPIARLRCAACCEPLETESTGVHPEDCDVPGSALVLDSVLRCPKCHRRYYYDGC